MNTAYKINAAEAMMLFQNDNDVLESEVERELRLHDLKRAVILSASPDHDTIIKYEDFKGNDRRMVTKVIGITEYNVILANQKLIPIHRVSKVVV